MTSPNHNALTRNITLYRWLRFLRSLLFWQAIWFLYYQEVLSAADAILLYALTDIATTVLEVPSGYMSDRLGRRVTLMASAVTGLICAILLVFGDTFLIFAIATMLFGASTAFSSGTDEAILYESLAATGREAELEHQEIVAWRYSFTAYALSAIVGGALAMIDMKLAYVAVVFAFIGLCWITWRMVEPPHNTRSATKSEMVRLRHVLGNVRNPVLMWFFALSVALYAFSHLPFVFGQPFILETLDTIGIAASAPLVSGTMTALMMGLSVVVSLVAIKMRTALGLPVLILAAFALQVGISGTMAVTDSAFVFIVLMLRMVPDALTRPFILGRIQPLMADDSRATWLSLQSFVGRLIFAFFLTLGAISTTDVGLMPYKDIQSILMVASLIGLFVLAGLMVTARRIAIEAPSEE